MTEETQLMRQLEDMVLKNPDNPTSPNPIPIETVEPFTVPESMTQTENDKAFGMLITVIGSFGLLLAPGGQPAAIALLLLILVSDEEDKI